MSRAVSFLRRKWSMSCEHPGCRTDTVDVNQICAEAWKNHVLPRRINNGLMNMLWCRECEVWRVINDLSALMVKREIAGRRPYYYQAHKVSIQSCLEFETDSRARTWASASVDLSLLYVVIPTGPAITLTAESFLRPPSGPRLRVVTFVTLVGFVALMNSSKQSTVSWPRDTSSHVGENPQSWFSWMISSLRFLPSPES
jgi:hypothetical protein